MKELSIFEQNLWQRLQIYSPDDPGSSFPFSRRLAQENWWSIGYALRVVEEFKRFAFLAIVAGHTVTPPIAVDEAWHLLMIYTREYWNVFCKDILGKELHHGPTKGGVEEDDKFDGLYTQTKESYIKFFEEAPPADIWPSNDVRFGQQFVRLNIEDHLIIKKDDFPFVTKIIVIFLNLVLKIKNMRNKIKIGATILGMLMLAMVSFGQSVPNFPSRPVLDQANVLSDLQEKNLNERIGSFEQKTSMQIRLVTVHDVSPYATASAYAEDVYHTWKLGDKDKHNGLLLVITQKIAGQSTDMKDYCRIMTGWGIVAMVPDTVVINEIKHRYMMPNLPSQPYLAFDNSLTRIFYYIERWQQEHPEDVTVQQKSIENVTSDSATTFPMTDEKELDSISGGHKEETSWWSNHWGWVLGGVVLLIIVIIGVNVTEESSDSYYRSSYNDGSTKKKKDSGSSSSSSCGSSFGSSGGGSSGCGSSCGSGCGGGGCGGGGCGS
ncbi:MAG TPA: TPM domain-containing protein [Candidatus Paceibacterota bacterium]